MFLFKISWLILNNYAISSGQLLFHHADSYYLFENQNKSFDYLNSSTAIWSELYKVIEAYEKPPMIPMLNITTLCKTSNPTKNLSPLNNHPYVRRR